MRAPICQRRVMPDSLAKIVLIQPDRAGASRRGSPACGRAIKPNVVAAGENCKPNARELGGRPIRRAPAIPGRSTGYRASSGVESSNPGVLGRGGEPSLSFTAKLRISSSQLTPRPRHATLLKSSAVWRTFSAGLYPVRRRSRSRPRDNRDMTVPIGTPSTRAASS